MAFLRSVCRGSPPGYILMCIVISTMLGMAGHNLTTELLQRPPNSPTHVLGQYYWMALLAIHAAQAAATMILHALISFHWRLTKFWIRVFAFALLVAVINENFVRRFLMDIIADHRNVGYEVLLVAIPAWMTFILVAWIIVEFSPSFRDASRFRYLLVLGATALAYQHAPVLLHAMLSAVFTLSPGGEFTQGPYGLNILIPIYTTYLVPVAGMYIAYLWIYESLPRRWRSLSYFLLLTGVHGQLLGVLQILTSHGNIINRVCYYGSFWWQLLIVAQTIVLLTGKIRRTPNTYNS